MKAFKIGDRIVWTGDLDSSASMKIGTVSKVRLEGNEPLVWVDGHEKFEDCIYAAYCWPISAMPKLLDILNRRAAAKRAFDDLMGEVYELRNAVARGEI